MRRRKLIVVVAGLAVVIAVGAVASQLHRLRANRKSVGEQLNTHRATTAAQT
jgi:hypothetical protein